MINELIAVFVMATLTRPSCLGFNCTLSAHPEATLSHMYNVV